MLPEAKLDILLAHHASLEAELLGQLSSEKYVKTCLLYTSDAADE